MANFRRLRCCECIIKIINYISISCTGIVVHPSRTMSYGTIVRLTASVSKTIMLHVNKKCIEKTNPRVGLKVLNCVFPFIPFSNQIAKAIAQPNASVHEMRGWDNSRPEWEFRFFLVRNPLRCWNTWTHTTTTRGKNGLTKLRQLQFDFGQTERKPRTRQTGGKRAAVCAVAMPFRCSRRPLCAAI